MRVENAALILLLKTDGYFGEIGSWVAQTLEESL